jgi:hypothetical protein
MFVCAVQCLRWLATEPTGWTECCGIVWGDPITTGNTVDSSSSFGLHSPPIILSTFSRCLPLFFIKFIIVTRPFGYCSSLRSRCGTTHRCMCTHLSLVLHLFFIRLCTFSSPFFRWARLAFRKIKTDTKWRHTAKIGGVLSSLLFSLPNRIERRVVDPNTTRAPPRQFCCCVILLVFLLYLSSAIHWRHVQKWVAGVDVFLFDIFISHVLGWTFCFVLFLVLFPHVCLTLLLRYYVVVCGSHGDGAFHRRYGSLRL